MLLKRFHCHFHDGSLELLLGIVEALPERALFYPQIPRCFARREFLYVDDAADAIVKAAQIHNDSQPINIGTGREVRIRELADMIAGLCGYRGAIGEAVFPRGRPDG